MLNTWTYCSPTYKEYLYMSYDYDTNMDGYATLVSNIPKLYAILQYEKRYLNNANPRGKYPKKLILARKG